MVKSTTLRRGSAIVLIHACICSCKRFMWPTVVVFFKGYHPRRPGNTIREHTLHQLFNKIYTPLFKCIWKFSQSLTEDSLSIFSYGETGVDVTTDARVLFDAVRHGKNHLVRFILEASSVDIVNSRDLHGKTPLMASCYTKVVWQGPF